MKLWKSGGLLSYSILANFYQTRLRSDCGAVRVCLCSCCSRMGDIFRNMPPLAFGTPINNTVIYRYIIGGLLLSCGDYNKRALSLPRDSWQGSQRRLRSEGYGVTQPVGYHV